MATTYEPIATNTLGSAAASITFSSIPATYTDLRVVFSVLDNAGSDDFYLRFNSDSTNKYSTTQLAGDGSAVINTRTTSALQIVVNGTGTSTTIPHFYGIDVFSYAGSTNKTLLIEGSEDENGSGIVTRKVGLYRSTTAISSLTFVIASGNFKSGTTATIYGIKNA